jgi:hypothetical protein
LSRNNLQRGEAMAGKRPDQHNIDPREAGATDYKNLPQKGQGYGSLDDTVVEDRQKLGQQGGPGSGGGPGQHFFDPNHPQPSHDANVHAAEGHAHGGGGEGMQAHGDTSEEMQLESPRDREAEGTEDPRDRGVGA